MGKQTALFAQHQELNGKIVDFGGWEMPLHYGSQIEEHHAVRQDAGMFDVSHMTVVDILGAGARDYLRHLLANDVDKIQGRGKALYTCMLNHHGGIIDDLIVYFLDVHHYRVVVNAATREKDLEWMNSQANGFSVGLHERDDLSMVAVQGPNGRAKANKVFTPTRMDAASTLRPFECVEADQWFIARTGYTGEDGFEVILPSTDVVEFWQALQENGVRPCGLGARDTLRLEAGLNLYGTDMDDTTSPLVSNLAWTIAWEPADRLFIGRASLELEKGEGVAQRLVGLVLQAKGVLRHGQKVIVDGEGEGAITSGTFSPTLSGAIALARVPAKIGEQCNVEIRGKLFPAKVVRPPFVKQGKATY